MVSILLLSGISCLSTVHGFRRMNVPIPFDGPQDIIPTDFNCNKYENDSYLYPSCEVLHWGATAIQAQREFMKQTLNGTEMSCFMHFPLASPDNQAIVTPNMDVTYSTAWVDLSSGHVTLKWDNPELFYIVQLLDFYQNVLYAPGSSKNVTSETMTLRYSDKFDQLCDNNDTSCVQSPTRIMWIVLRMEYTQDNWQANVNAKDTFSVGGVGNCSTQPADWTNTPSYWKYDYVGNYTYPWVNISQVWNLAPPYNQSMIFSKDNYPIKAVATNTLISQATSIGVANGTFDPYKDFEAMSIISKETNEAWERFFTILPDITRGYVNSTNLDPCKKFSADREGTFIRNVVAIGYIAENCAQDAVYYGAYNDGNPLNKLTCENGINWKATLPSDVPVLPGTQGYWSITMYRADTFSLVSNRLDRYSFNDKNSKKSSSGYDYILTNDTSLHIPSDFNLLPAPTTGNFYVLVRTYGPIPGSSLNLTGTITEYESGSFE